MPKQKNLKARLKKLPPATVLFFCLFFLPVSLLAANSAPKIVLLSPSSGTSTADRLIYFTTYFSDANGWQNIQYAHLLINTSISGSRCFYGYYNQNTNKLYLRDDNNSSWLGGYTPGSSNVIENSYVKLDCSKCIKLSVGTTLIIRWAITFKSTFGGAKKTYLYVKDDSGAYAGWTQKGTYAINVTDTTSPTGNVKINNDSQYINSNTVTLNLSAQDNTGGSGLSQMQFSNDNTVWSASQSYTTTKSWALASGEGTKTVYVKFKDAAGNWSQSYSDTIILDTIPPQIAISPVPGFINQNVILSYIVSDNLTPQNAIIIEGNNSPYITEGAHNATLTAKDKANNSVSKAISFTIDKTKPDIVITSPSDGAVMDVAQIEVKGTVDGVAFTDNIILAQEGENIITKTATDAAGNSATLSIKVNLYSGELIGTEGGVVVSPDGKVKLTIPQGALDSATKIKINNISNSVLENTTPQNDSLLSAVECKPYGLVFNKPASMVYVLNQAEIPGTSVELGYYDAVQDKIIPTGQISAVATDSYTVNFSVMHFSTYAALKSLISSGAPIGSGVQIPLPDMFTGSFGHAIPITVSPGRKGMQPSLGLSYRSSNPNSWVGTGYSLNPGYIVRSTRLGPPSYNDTQDTFYFITDAGTTELVHLTDNLYQAKIESSFAKFFKESDDSWKVQGKDGSILRFGQNANAKEVSSLGTFSWYVTKAVDTNKNYIEYTYIKDQGKSYLSRIDYTGNEAGFSPTNSVEFFLEGREDVPSSYISSAKIATAKRLKEIQVKVNSDLVWKYILEYEYSQDTNRSLLKSVTQQGADGKELPKQRFTYQRAK
ncbi:MAG: SpvB/TcaC N-terminal domain-containing protein [Candidatus Omnitrophota bacterium]|jgi:hypothetical protein